MTAEALAILAAALTEAVAEAGQAVMTVYNSDFAVEHKDDKSPVTAADAAGEEIILRHLARLTPDIPVVAEEAAAAGSIPDVSAGLFWLVDPLDGTKEFIKRNGEFTVNIGLIEDGVPVLGLVLAPVLETLYVGWQPRDAATGEAFREVKGVREPMRCRVPGPEGVVVLASRSHANDSALSAYLDGVTVASVTNAGSSLKFCRVAEAAADLYPRFGPTCEWDTAAAHAVLRAAGGSVTMVDGSPFVYGKQADRFLNPHFIARGAVA